MKSNNDILMDISKYNIENNLNKAFPKIWEQLSKKTLISTQEKPIGILLGGQPGAGKSFGTNAIKEKLNSNVIIINGDEFRSLHEHYDDFYQLYGKDASKYTGEFAGKMVEKIRDEAIKNRFNIIIEGTFRTTETPLRELDNFQKQGYETQVVICTCPKELSWQSTINRGDELENLGLQPRYVPKEHHDIVVEKLANNVAIIFNSGLVSHLEIYSREAKLFDSKIDNPNDIKQVIDNELNGLNKKYQIEFIYNRELSENVGKRSYDVFANGIKTDELLKKDDQFSIALDGLAQHRDIQAKGISAESLKSGTVQPLKLSYEITINRPQSRIINIEGKEIKPQAKQNLQAEKSTGFEL